MWRVLLAFVTHRLILYVAALWSINAQISKAPQTGFLPKSEPFSVLNQEFVKRVSTIPEVTTLNGLSSAKFLEVFKHTTSPFLWICHWLRNVFGLSPTLAAILLSTIFFLLFLSELYQLIGRMSTLDVAVNAAVLMVLWPSSFEMNLGFSFSMTCYLLLHTARQAIDDRWLQCGLCLGALTLMEPISAGLFPLVAYFFWYFQRHYMAAQVVKKAVFVLLPFGLALYWELAHVGLSTVFRGSALQNLFSTLQANESLRWALTRSMAGQTITLVVFTGGAIAAAVSNVAPLFRILPIYYLVLLLLFSPYSAIASRAAIAAPALQGLASISSRPVLKLVQFILLLLGIYEVYAVFG